MKIQYQADECYGRDTLIRYTEGAILSGQVTITRRTSGETVKAPKGQVREHRIISQAKGQSIIKYRLLMLFMFSEVKSLDLTFLIF